MILPIPAKAQPTKRQMESAARWTLAELANASKALLQRLTDADPTKTEELRSEITRLAGISHIITRYLHFDDVARAYKLINGDTVDGEALGLTAIVRY